MKGIILAALVSAPLVAMAAPGNLSSQCSTKASKTTKKSELLAAAKIQPAEAQKIALNHAKATKVVKGGIETEDGCLIYSFHVKSDGDKGQTEVFVDAGDGKVLGSEKEGAVRAALEKPVDKTKELAGKTKEAVTGKESTNQAMPPKK